MWKVVAIVGARPQFIKHFAFENEAKRFFDLKTIHTGQHYDENMSKVFFDELGMKKPDLQLNLGGGNHGMQTGKMMIELEYFLEVEKPDLLVVYGDTNSTLAGALVAAKLQMPIAHIEAGLRSFNREMPEEINRVLTDHLSSLMFVPSEVAKANLAKEGLTERVFICGDIMKDLVLKAIERKWVGKNENNTDYYYVTLHRPYNTDDKDRLMYVLESVNALKKKSIFSIHPRTRMAMRNYNLKESDYANIDFIDPQPYFSNLGFLYNSAGLITDSGGMQKEAYWLKKKCITVRKETEWLETLFGKANCLMFDHLENMDSFLTEPIMAYDNDLYGNGKTSHQIVQTMVAYLS